MPSAFDDHSRDAVVFFPRRTDTIDSALRAVAPSYPYLLLHEPLTILARAEGLELWTDRKAEQPSGLIPWTVIVSIGADHAPTEEGYSSALALRLRVANHARTVMIPLRMFATGARELPQFAADRIATRLHEILESTDHAEDLPDQQRPAPELLNGTASTTLRKRAVTLLSAAAASFAIGLIVLLTVPQAAREHPFVWIPATILAIAGCLTLIPAGINAILANQRAMEEASAGYTLDPTINASLPALDPTTGTLTNRSESAPSPRRRFRRWHVIALVAAGTYFVTAAALATSGAI